MVRELIYPIAEILRKKNNPQEISDFLATLHAAEEKFGTSELWNREFIDGIKAFSKSSYIQGLISARIHSFPKTYKTWNEYQLLLNDIYNVLDPVVALTSDAALTDLRLARAGFVYVNFQALVKPKIIASDSTVLGNPAGYASRPEYCSVWNSTLVPYEKALGNKIEYLSPVKGANGDLYVRKSPFENTIWITS